MQTQNAGSTPNSTETPLTAGEPAASPPASPPEPPPTTAVAAPKPKRVRKPRAIILRGPSGEVMRAVETLGLPKATWNRVAMMALNEFGSFINVPLAARVCLTTTFDSLDQIKTGYKVASEIANDPNRTTEDRLSGCQMIALIAKAHKDMVGEIVKLTKEAQDKKPDLEKPRNLPPQTAIQINYGNGQASPQVTVKPAEPAAIPDAEPAEAADE